MQYIDVEIKNMGKQFYTRNRAVVHESEGWRFQHLQSTISVWVDQQVNAGFCCKVLWLVGQIRPALYSFIMLNTAHFK